MEEKDMKKYNLKAIMERAWEIKREHKANIFGFCLEMAWAEAKAPKEEVKNYEIKKWFLEKNFSQNERYIINLAVISGELNVLNETEKAIQFKADSDFGYIKFWCPKSCLTENMTEQEKRWEEKRKNNIVSGIDYNHKLIEFAKANGIKGVRVGMKTLTLKQKISAAGFVIPQI